MIISTLQVKRPRFRELERLAQFVGRKPEGHLGFSESIPWASCMKQSPSHPWLCFSGLGKEGGIRVSTKEEFNHT